MTHKSWTNRRRFKRTDRRWNSQDNVTTETDNSTVKSIAEDSTGTDKPNFRSLIREQQDASNAYSATGKMSVHTSYGYGRHDYYVKQAGGDIKYFDETSGFLGDFGVITSGTVSSSAVNRAKASFVQKASAEISPFKGGVFLGELKETIELIRHPAKALFTALDSHLTRLGKFRRSFTRAQRKVKQRFLSSQWLELQYGIKPLIADINDAAKALADFNTRSFPTTKVYGNASDMVYSFDDTSLKSNNNLAWSFNRLVYELTKVQFSGAVKTETATTAPYSTAFSRAGLTLSEFVPTVYELIPYSFLVDYFSNIGDILQAMSFCRSNLVYSVQSTYTARVIELSECKDESVEFKGPLTFTTKRHVSAGKSTAKVVLFSRSVNPSLVPGLEFKVPGLGSNRWLNMAALLEQHKRITPF